MRAVGKFERFGGHKQRREASRHFGRRRFKDSKQYALRKQAPAWSLELYSLRAPDVRTFAFAAVLAVALANANAAIDVIHVAIGTKALPRRVPSRKLS
jgi:hypothetical protein